MTRRDKERIKKRAREITVEELEAEYYKAVFDCLGSQTERMYELGYDIADIMEREKIEDDLCEEADVLEEICYERGIRLWQKEAENESNKDTV